MMVSEWREIVDEVAALWGPSRKWSEADTVYRYARHIPVAAVRIAVETLFLEGKSTAPSPAEVIAAARMRVEHHTTQSELDAYCQENGHLYGIVEDSTTSRTGICGRCGDVLVTTPDKLTTLAERESGEVEEVY